MAVMNIKNCYCAFCKTKRRVSQKKHINLRDVFYCFVLSMLLMFLIWQDFNPRVAVLFALIVGMCGYFAQLRWRLQMACPQCGFDPIIYLREPKKAVRMVKEHLGRWENSPKKWFLPNPNKNLYHRKPSELSAEEKQLRPVNAKSPEVDKILLSEPDNLASP